MMAGSERGVGKSEKTGIDEDEEDIESKKTFESKADALHFGIPNEDWTVRRAAAMELPDLCERRPVEGYVIREYLKLLSDLTFKVRIAALEGLPRMVEPRDKAAVRAVLERLWGDVSWAVRLAAIKVIEKLAEPGDQQVILALLGRVGDPEASRGLTFPVREAALQATLRFARVENSIHMVMHRIRNESWEERAAALQVLLLAARKIPCRLDDQHHPLAPKNQGFTYHSAPVHQDPEMPYEGRRVRKGGKEDEEEEDGEFLNPSERRQKVIGNGYKPTTLQGEILPFQVLPKWHPPPLEVSKHERGAHEWHLSYQFALEGSGLEESYHTENCGRHYKQTKWSLALQMKARTDEGRPQRQRGPDIEKDNSASFQRLASLRPQEDERVKAMRRDPRITPPPPPLPKEKSEEQRREEEQHQALVQANKAQLKFLASRRKVAQLTAAIEHDLSQSMAAASPMANVKTRPSVRPGKSFSSLEHVGERYLGEDEDQSSSAPNLHQRSSSFSLGKQDAGPAGSFAASRPPRAPKSAGSEGDQVGDAAPMAQPQRRGSFRRGQSGVKLLGGVTSLGDLQVGAHIDDFFDKSADSEAQFNVVSLDMLAGASGKAPGAASPMQQGQGGQGGGAAASSPLRKHLPRVHHASFQGRTAQSVLGRAAAAQLAG
mmetsp:Transcript_13676/g.32500  ORF Transcript_13676/g.32500 Transcript_13676/m.32500 type:complete len:660 (-) Transcript_13676:129-2108(-)